jgi:hypothetical protein
MSRARAGAKESAMSKRLTITLTDEEYGDLERLALQERRSEREMAAYLIVKYSKPATAGSLILSPQEAQRRILQQQYSAGTPNFGIVN